jgi:predicted nucleotidyltransferase
MGRIEINNIIINYLTAYQPASIGIFGSYARGENKIDSDIDILVDLKTQIGLLEFVKIGYELSELLGIKVDLVTEKSLKNEKIKKYIHTDLQVIYKA